MRMRATEETSNMRRMPRTQSSIAAKASRARRLGIVAAATIGLAATALVPPAASGRLANVTSMICGLRCGSKKGARELATGDATSKAHSWLGSPRSYYIGGVSCEGPYGDARGRTQWTCEGVAVETAPKRVTDEFQINLGPFGEITYERHARY